MKIAFATQDGQTISRHFGRAPHYLVVTIDNGIEVQRELRDKVSHGSHEHGVHAPGDERHGYGAQEQARHFQMADAIPDCGMVVCGGMGQGAYDHLSLRGIKPILTDLRAIDDAIKAYLSGQLTDLSQQLLH